MHDISIVQIRDRRSLPGFQSLGAFEKESRRQVSSKIEVIPNKVRIIRLYTITQILLRTLYSELL